jgi:hypothetical protein
MDSPSTTIFLNTQYPWIIDVGTVVLPSWLLLWASPTIRKQIANDFIPSWIRQKLCGNPSNVVFVLNPTNVINTQHQQQQRKSWTGGEQININT